MSYGSPSLASWNAWVRPASPRLIVWRFNAVSNSYPANACTLAHNSDASIGTINASTAKEHKSPYTMHKRLLYSIFAFGMFDNVPKFAIRAGVITRSNNFGGLYALVRAFAASHHKTFPENFNWLYKGCFINSHYDRFLFFPPSFYNIVSSIDTYYS